MTSRAIGLDLGTLADFSALSLIDWQPSEAPAYHLRTLKRWPLKTPYGHVAADLAAFCALPELTGAVIVADATGAGLAVCEMIQAALAGLPVRLVRAVITAGSAVSQPTPGMWRIAKKELVSRMQVVLGQRRLHVATGLELAPVLVRELENYKVKVTAAQNETFESWREKDHDDVCFAVMLSLWWAERRSHWGEGGVGYSRGGLMDEAPEGVFASDL